MNRVSKYLLDTQILIWFFSGELQESTLEVVKNPNNVVYLSVVNVWEIILKSKKGKLRVPTNIGEAIDKSGFDVLSVNLEHVLGLRKLPWIHTDPFDRMLIVQAKTENLTLISSDKKLSKYKLSLIKA